MNSSALTQLIETVHRLRAPGGCPWDRAQTHQSLRQYLIEEAYEVLDIIDQINSPEDLKKTQIQTAFKEELGDLLMQVVLHSEMTHEAGLFDISDVAQFLNEKLIRRHPHVFGEGKEKTADSALQRWEKEKAKEKASQPDASVLDGVPKGLPALQRAARVLEKVTKVGFQWKDMEGPLQKVDEELNEFKAEVLALEKLTNQKNETTPVEGDQTSNPDPASSIQGHSTQASSTQTHSIQANSTQTHSTQANSIQANSPRANSTQASSTHANSTHNDSILIDSIRKRIESELGDLIFTLCNVAYLMKINPEASLRGTMSRFENRFRYVERQIKQKGKLLEHSDLAEMDQHWDEAKKLEKVEVWGLTGGIGSGKTTVGSYFSEFGIPVIDADLISRELLQPGGSAYDPVIAALGTAERSKLRDLVFKNAEARSQLESILHPLIQAESKKRIESLGLQHPIIIYEATLLVETGRSHEMKGLIVVEAPETVRIARIKSRSQISDEVVRQIIDSQTTDETRRKHATLIIQNSGSLENLRSQVENFIRDRKWK